MTELIVPSHLGHSARVPGGSNGLDDQVYNRLLKERIIFLGSAVEDSMANAIWKQLLADFQPPPLDPAIDEALRDFVARRKEQGGALAA